MSCNRFLCMNVVESALRWMVLSLPNSGSSKAVMPYVILETFFLLYSSLDKAKIFPERQLFCFNIC